MISTREKNMPIIGPGITIGPGILIGEGTLGSLYSFTNFTFTNGTILGRSSGNTTQFLANYSNVGNTWIDSTSYYRVTTPGYQVWTVPQTATYEIEVAGSRSGINTYANNTFGHGAIVRGRFALQQGSNITIAVGSFSANTINNNGFNGAGGGGGSFVVVTNTGNPLIIGGGGGGSGRYSSSTDGNTGIKLGVNGATTTYGTSSRNAPFGNAAPGGRNGLGGNSHIAANGVVSLNSYDGGAGGGFLSNGASGTGNANRPGATSGTHGQGGLGFSANLQGGSVATTYTSQGSNGGFGGGGGGSPIAGGGGGGYSGGGGGYASSSTSSDGGGGGGSYIDANATTVATSDGFYNTSSTFGGASITNIGSFNANAGYVKITLIG
jgi:hypothetical protein